MSRSLEGRADKELVRSKPSGYVSSHFKSAIQTVSSPIRSLAVTSDGYAIFLDAGIVQIYSQENKLTQRVKLNPEQYSFTTSLCWNSRERSILYYNLDQVGSVEMNQNTCEDTARPR